MQISSVPLSSFLLSLLSAMPWFAHGMSFVMPERGQFRPLNLCEFVQAGKELFDVNEFKPRWDEGHDERIILNPWSEVRGGCDKTLGGAIAVQHAQQRAHV